LSQDFGGKVMATRSAPEQPQRHRAEVKWPVTLLTPNGPIEAETEYISLSHVLVVSKTSLPSEGDIGLLIQAPNHEVVHMTSELVCTKVNGSDHTTTCFSAELQITYVSAADKEFLCRIIANNNQRRIARSVQRKKTSPKVDATASTSATPEPDTLDVQLPVSYKQSGKTVAARATRFSPKGCLVLTKKPHQVGTVFSLKITNPKSKRSIQVDSLVSLRKLSSANKRWGMLLQFINLTKRDREELCQVLADPGEPPKTSIKSKYLDTFKGFVLNILPK
jgi:hypothetical protein